MLLLDFINVGNGDATLVRETDSGFAMLVDCGTTPYSVTTIPANLTPVRNVSSRAIFCVTPESSVWTYYC